MFTHQRESLRNFYLETLEKIKNKHILSPLESQVAEILLAHPEYLKDLEDIKILEKDFSVELGEINPFLHLGLHMGLQEQVLTNRPAGIQEIYQNLLIKYAHQDPHEIQHLMMDQLAEILWLSQKYQTNPDEQKYLEKLRWL